jgi:hypothetical protein
MSENYLVNSAGISEKKCLCSIPDFWAKDTPFRILTGCTGADQTVTKISILQLVEKVIGLSFKG